MNVFRCGVFLMSFKFLCCYLKTKTIVSRNINSVLSSITVAGAILWNIYRVYGEEIFQEMLREFTGEKEGEESPFVVGSPFPYVEIRDRIFRLYPAPKVYRLYTLKPVQSEEDYKKYRIYKLVKKLEYVTESLLEELIDWRLDEFNSKLEEKLLNGDFDIKKNILLGKKEEELSEILDEGSLYELVIEPHTAINRLTGGASEGQLFNLEKIYYNENAGLWFPIAVKPEYEEEVKTAINMLSIFGIGGKKSLGQGSSKTKPEIGECKNKKLWERGGGNTYYLLSHITATREVIEYNGIDLPNSYYTIVGRQGTTENQVGFFVKNWYPVMEPGSLLKLREPSRHNPLMLGKAIEVVSENNMNLYDIGIGMGIAWGEHL